MVNKTSQKVKNSYHSVFTQFGEKKGYFESKFRAWITQATVYHLTNHPNKVNPELFCYIFMVSFFNLMHFLVFGGHFPRGKCTSLEPHLFLQGIVVLHEAAHFLKGNCGATAPSNWRECYGAYFPNILTNVAKQRILKVSD